MAPTPAAVVDARYCTPHAKSFEVTKFTIPWNEFVARDASGAAVMQIESAGFHSYLLVDVSASSRRPVLTIDPLLSLFGRSWLAYRGNSTSRSNLLFHAAEGSSLFTMADIHVHLAGRGERHPDFTVTTGLFSREYTVSRGAGSAVAQIVDRGGWLLHDYEVSVNAGVDHAFILALTAILEDIRMDNVRRKRT